MSEPGGILRLMHITGGNWAFNTRDLMRASTCAHCTTLSVLHALNVPRVEERLGPYIEKQRIARELGEDKTLPQKYGELYEEQLTQELIENSPRGTLKSPSEIGNFNETVDLMRAGVPVIYQGGLEHLTESSFFRGRPDFLVKSGWRLEFRNNSLHALKDSSSTDQAGYTVWDAKYSSHPKPEYALQVAIYIDALESLGLKAGNAIHGLVLGNRTLTELREGEIVPAARLARQHLEGEIRKVQQQSLGATLENFEWHCAGPKDCELCEYPELCEDERKHSGDLILVAGLGKAMRSKLKQHDIQTITDLATSPLEKIPGVSKSSFEKLRLQAKAQLRSTEEVPFSELLPDPMIQFLPKPSPKDVFFDMEGFPYFRDGGLEYLLGNWTKDEGFTDFWAYDHTMEKQAFEEFMSWIMNRMDQDPNAHIYHYASYERTALRRLALRHSVMQQELTQLEKQGRFVDLLEYVKHSVRVGEPSYSIKKLERHYGFVRTADVSNASDSIDGYQDWRDLVLATENPNLGLDQLEEISAKERKAYQSLHDYNMEDVQSTMYLYEWLCSKEGACSKLDQKPVEPDDEGGTLLTNSELELQDLIAKTERFFEPIKHLEKGKDPILDWKIQAWETLAHSILFYRREDVMFWADLNIRIGQDDEAFENDREALLLTDVMDMGEQVSKNGNVSNQFQATISSDSLYEPKVKDELVVRFPDQAGFTRRGFGKITAVQPGMITFNVGLPENLEDDAKPDAVIKFQRFFAQGKQAQLNKLAEEITSAWQSPKNEPPRGSSALDLLLRNVPRLKTGNVAEPNRNDYLPALIDTVERMDGTVLAVQGPPGSGKTYLASRLIKHLLVQGKSVAVATNSHSAVENVLFACIEAGIDPESIFKANKSDESRNLPWQSAKSAGEIAKLIARHRGAKVLGGTAFALSNANVRANHFDYLIIDEAAQFSLVDALAVSGIAKNMILFGDPQQLPQVVQAVHPGGSENSALGHYMGDHDILPEGMGYFVAVTRRLHPAVNKAVSWLSYEGQLESHQDTEKNVIHGVEPGLHSVEMAHSGNSIHSPEEVAAVLQLVTENLARVPRDQILIVAPYNAQVNAIRKALDSAALTQLEVGTVDKFQGREAMVVIYSFTASSANDAPRGLDFLLDRNRLNVAISRAKSVCYLVHSPELLKAQFKKLSDVKSVSRLSMMLGLAQVV